MSCPRCGLPPAPGASYCSRCGTRVEPRPRLADERTQRRPAAPPPSAQPPPAAAPPPVTTPDRSSPPGLLPAPEHTRPGQALDPVTGPPRPARSRRLVLGVVAGAAALLAGFGGTYLLVRDRGPGNSAKQPAAAAQEKKRTEATDVAAAIKGLEKDPATVLAADARKLVPDVRTALPPGTTVTPREATWAPDGTGVGGTMAVDVTYPSTSPQGYLAVMVHERSGWKVLATLAVSP